MQCSDDKYMLDGQVYSLDYRPIEGDVSLPQNVFHAPSFIPQGKYIWHLLKYVFIITDTKHFYLTMILMYRG